MDVVYEKAPGDVFPKCPHCKERLKKVWIKTKGLGIMKSKQIIICPSCETFLAFGAAIR